MAAKRIPNAGPATLGVHAGSPISSEGGPVVLPVVQSATFYGGGPNQTGELLYTRYGNNPNQLEVAHKVAALEDMEAALALGSGMAATAMTVLALAQSGDHFIASKHLYGATKLLFRSELRRRGVKVDFVDPEVTRQWRSAVRPNTRLLFLEIPTNPTLRVFDPRPLAQLAAELGIPLVVDATFASPINIRLAQHGVDVIINSATKYLGGHSDLIAGVVSGSRPLISEVQKMMKLYGPALDPHAAWLLARGIRTLSVRMARHNENALSLAEWFEARPEVARVLYPGLESHPDHEVAKELMSGFGGMLGIVLEGGGAAADVFTQALEVALLAPSLGGVETLVSQPRFTSHVGVSPNERAAMGIPDGFVRISVGIEDVHDLQRDFEQALAATSGQT